MDIGLNLARFWGILISVLALAPLVNRKIMEGEKESKENYSTIFILGLVSLIAGALQVSFYNVWELNYKGLVTLMGWITMVRSALRLFVPDTNRRAMQMPNVNRILYLSSAGALLLGIYFIAVSFGVVPHWLGG